MPGPGETPVLIAGGHGAAALYLLAKASPSPGVVCVGACLTSVVRVRTGPDSWEYRRACGEGPVFDAHIILWDA